MARGQGVFASLGVTGSIGDTFTFSQWKGIQVIKKKPTPSNPNTAGQQVNRSQYGDAVVAWHNIKLEKQDKTAWDLRASKGSRPMSGFNSFISLYRLAGLTNTHVLLYGMTFALSGVQVQPIIKADTGCNITFKIIRGPDAGYSETLPAAADAPIGFADVDINPANVCVFTADNVGDTGESGYHYSTVD